jgi:hypothetical protein
MVRVRYSEGIANHTGPESCASTVGDGGREALTGELSGWVLSHEMTFRMPTLFRERKATRAWRYREPSLDPARSKTPA